MRWQRASFTPLKVELTHGERLSTRDELRRGLFDCIETDYNRIQRHSALGHRSPVAFEAAQSSVVAVSTVRGQDQEAPPRTHGPPRIARDRSATRSLGRRTACRPESDRAADARSRSGGGSAQSGGSARANPVSCCGAADTIVTCGAQLLCAAHPWCGPGSRSLRASMSEARGCAIHDRTSHPAAASHRPARTRTAARSRAR